MKLRLRSLESRETRRIEVPNSFDLLRLKEAIMHQLSLSSSTSSSDLDGNLLLSLNRTDELCGSSPEDSLQSLGITSGDLIYYSFNPSAFSQNPNLSDAQSNPNNQNRDIGDTQLSEPSNLSASIAESDKDRDSKDAQKEGTSKLRYPNDKSHKLVDFKKEEHLEKAESSEKFKGVEDMEVDDKFLVEGTTKFSMPTFLKKVFTKELGDVANGGDHKLLVIAVHAVLLESGFVAYDPLSGMKVDGFHLNDEWPKSAFGLSLHYTLPELASSEVVEGVVLRFQTLGKFLNIYGSLAVGKKGFGSHRVCLDEPRYIPALSFIMMNREHFDSGKSFPNREIFEFWKMVKDGVSYPLLIDLCERASLVPPPCLMMLPTELKLTILEKLPALDVARLSCVSSELRFVASNNELWRLKYKDYFGKNPYPQSVSQWKAIFSSAWKNMKNRKRVCMPNHWRREPTTVFRPVFPGRRGPSLQGSPNLPGSPFIIGGDFDRVPPFGVPQRRGLVNWRLYFDRGGFGP